MAFKAEAQVFETAEKRAPTRADGMPGGGFCKRIGFPASHDSRNVRGIGDFARFFNARREAAMAQKRREEVGKRGNAGDLRLFRFWTVQTLLKGTWSTSSPHRPLWIRTGPLPVRIRTASRPDLSGWIGRFGPHLPHVFTYSCVHWVLSEDLERVPKMNAIQVLNLKFQRSAGHAAVSEFVFAGVIIEFIVIM